MWPGGVKWYVWAQKTFWTEKLMSYGTWQLCAFVKTHSTAAWKAKPEVHWIQWVAHSVQMCGIGICAVSTASENDIFRMCPSIPCLPYPQEQDACWIPSKHSGFPQALPFLHLCLHVDLHALSHGAQPAPSVLMRCSSLAYVFSWDVGC